MGIFDSIMGQVGQHADVGNLAAKLGLSEETIKAHIKNILCKLAANDRTHAVTIALKRGIIEV